MQSDLPRDISSRRRNPAGICPAPDCWGSDHAHLLRFRDVADYSANPELAPREPISGAEAYQLYIAHTLPHLRRTGGDLIFFWARRPVPDRTS